MNRLSKVPGLPTAKVEAWQKLPPHEIALQLAAWLCDTQGIKETAYNNRHPWIDEFHRTFGLPLGQPWCALFVSYCRRAAGLSTGPRPASALGCSRDFLKPSKSPVRGGLAYRDHGKGLGHVGFAVKSLGPLVWTIEGNTMAEKAGGNQRNGDGLYRRIRLKRYWTGFTTWEPR